MADDVIKYHRTAATYVSTVIDSGVRISKLLEPMWARLEEPSRQLARIAGDHGPLRPRASSGWTRSRREIGSVANWTQTDPNCGDREFGIDANSMSWLEINGRGERI